MLIPQFDIQGYSIEVILPYDYELSRATYPVVYVQDGGDMVIDGYNQLDHFVRTNEIQACIYVGIEPVNRHDDYTPWPAPGLKDGAPRFGGKGRNYLQFLESTIKPYIDEHYRTKPEARYTTIAGASLGGLISLFASYWNPSTFGNYILISPSVWYEGVLDYLQNKKPFIDRTEQQIVMYVGELEGIYHATSQQFMVPCAMEAASLLKSENFSNSYFLTDPKGTHDAHFFTHYFIHAMKKLFPGDNVTTSHA